jgi:hypothetical protein
MIFDTGEIVSSVKNGAPFLSELCVDLCIRPGLLRTVEATLETRTEQDLRKAAFIKC